MLVVDIVSHSENIYGGYLYKSNSIEYTVVIIFGLQYVHTIFGLGQQHMYCHSFRSMTNL